MDGEEGEWEDGLFADDVIQNIVAFLCMADVLRFSSTCRRYREVSFSCLVFDEMTIKLYDDPYRVQKMLSLFPKLQSLTIKGGGIIDYTSEIPLCESLNLTSLTVEDNPRLADNFLEILSRCRMYRTGLGFAH